MPKIPISKVKVATRQRQLHPGKVQEIADSIDLLGLLQPVVAVKDNGSFRLLAGNHRLEAFKILGKKEIPAQVMDLDRIHHELAEIDENLKRANLSAIEEGEHLLSRDDILECLGIRASRGDNRYTLDRPNTVRGLKTTRELSGNLGRSVTGPNEPAGMQ